MGIGDDLAQSVSSPRAVYLDRDGVLNRALVREGKPYPPKCAADVEILPDVPEALRSLKAAGFVLVVVSNQPDVARGSTTRAEVEAINAVLSASLPIDRFQMCYHDDGDRCACRKPLPGMLQEAARELSIDLRRSYMVGDRWRDIEAGAAAGCSTIFIDNGYSEREPVAEDHRVHSMAEAAHTILDRELSTTKQDEVRT